MRSIYAFRNQYKDIESKFIVFFTDENHEVGNEDSFNLLYNFCSSCSKEHEIIQREKVKEFENRFKSGEIKIVCYL